MLLQFTEAVYGKPVWIEHTRIAVIYDCEHPLKAGRAECKVHLDGDPDGWRLLHSAVAVRDAVELENKRVYVSNVLCTGGPIQTPLNFSGRTVIEKGVEG